MQSLFPPPPLFLCACVPLHVCVCECVCVCALQPPHTVMPSTPLLTCVCVRTLQPLHTVMPSTPLLTALGMLLETGVSALPVVDEKRCLLDVYARSDITQLCRGNAYNRLQWEDVTVRVCGASAVVVGGMARVGGSWQPPLPPCLKPGST